ncbi:MAG: N-acetyl-gamma-glutamyl-phosphate reductase, partial [Saprospiraceae bacterium]
MIKAGIIGGTGYTAGELLRILLHHPKVEISFIYSNSFAGKAVSNVHTDLVGEIDLHFTKDWNQKADVIFLCLPHEASAPFLEAHHIDDSIKIIDLSSDFRIKNEDHQFIYGLPEMNKSLIQQSSKIANCGCFATAIQLALLPLAAQQLLNKDIHIHAITGSTGAGKSPGTTTHFSWRNNNVSVYKAFRHQHLEEIAQSLEFLQPGFDQELNFIPVRGNFARGIFASIYTDIDQPLEVIKDLYNNYYKGAPFVFITE